MVIRKTGSYKAKSVLMNISGEQQKVMCHVTTYWFLFIPIYSVEEMHL